MHYKYRKNFFYFLSFIIPAFIMLLASILNEFYPFGNNNLLISDCGQQYVDYLSYFKTIFTGNNDFIYTFSKNMGGDMIGFSAYYLLSPFNIILLLFSAGHLPIAIFIIVLLKIGLCGFTFNYFLNKIKPFSAYSIIFSSSYALMGYNMAYFWDIMWLDGVILLPVIILGLEKIFEKRELSALYIISLALAILINYYIGFMICIFTVIYFIYRFLHLINKISDMKENTGIFVKYVISSIIAVGISCIVIIPVVFSLIGGQTSFTLSFDSFYENFKFMDVFAKLYTGNVTGNELVNGLPNIFCGTFTVLLTVIYFLNSDFKFKDKLLKAMIISVVLISFHFNPLNLMWHAFNRPNWFPYRYSFTFSFVLIMIAYEVFEHALKYGIKKNIIINAVIIFIASTIIIFKNTYAFANIICIYEDVFLCVVFGLLLYSLYAFKYNKHRSRIISAAMLFFVLINLLFNAAFSIKKLLEFSSVPTDRYVSYVNETGSAVDLVKSEDTGFYRLEKTFWRDYNDPMQFSYNGLSHFSSSEKKFVKDFMGRLGFRNNGNWACYGTGTTATADSLLGVKYLLSKNGIYGKTYYEKYKVNDITVYENPYALPLGFAANEKIMQTDIKAANIFETQNYIWNSIAGNMTKNIFEPAEVIDCNYENLIYSVHDGNETYERADSNAAYVIYTIKISSEDVLYMYMSAPARQEAEIFINDTSLGVYFGTYRWNIVPLGSFNIGDTVQFKIKVNGSSLTVSDALFYYENMETLSSYRDEIAPGFCSLQKLSSSHLKGTVNAAADNTRILFTIPYEEDWRVYIDGNIVEADKAFDALLSVPVTEGEHTLELKYVPRGLYTGISISAVSVTVFICVALAPNIFKGNRLNRKYRKDRKT